MRRLSGALHQKGKWLGTILEHEDPTATFCLAAQGEETKSV
jgi:hypothetical protein